MAGPVNRRREAMPANRTPASWKQEERSPPKPVHLIRLHRTTVPQLLRWWFAASRMPHWTRTRRRWYLSPGQLWLPPESSLRSHPAWWARLPSRRWPALSAKPFAPSEAPSVASAVPSPVPSAAPRRSPYAGALCPAATRSESAAAWTGLPSAVPAGSPCATAQLPSGAVRAPSSWRVMLPPASWRPPRGAGPPASSEGRSAPSAFETPAFFVARPSALGRYLPERMAGVPACERLA